MCAHNPGSAPVDEGPSLPRSSQRIRDRNERDARVKAAIQAAAAAKTVSATQDAATTIVVSQSSSATVLEPEQQIEPTLSSPASKRLSKTPAKALAVPSVAGTSSLGVKARKPVVKTSSKTPIGTSVRTPVKVQGKTLRRDAAKELTYGRTSADKGKGRARNESPPTPVSTPYGSTSAAVSVSSFHAMVGMQLENDPVSTRSRLTQALGERQQEVPQEEVTAAPADLAADAVFGAHTIATTTSAALVAAVVAAVTAATADFALPDTAALLAPASAMLLPAVPEPMTGAITTHQVQPAASAETSEANSTVYSLSPSTPSLTTTDISADLHLQALFPPQSSTRQQPNQALVLLSPGHPSPALSVGFPEDGRLRELSDALYGFQEPEGDASTDDNAEETQMQAPVRCPLFTHGSDTKEISDNRIALLEKQRVLSHERRLKRKVDNDDDGHHSEEASRKSCKVRGGQCVETEINPIKDEIPQVGATPRFEHLVPDGIQMNEWIKQITDRLLADHMLSTGPSANPLSTVIYWMPRIPPADGLDQRAWGGQFQYWVIPVWPVCSSTDFSVVSAGRISPRPVTAPQSKSDSFVYHLRTTDVAHWLHISTQDLVAFLSLAHPKELEALNLYLNFRRELMLYIPFMPTVIQWAKNKVPLGPDDHMHKLFANIKALDDEHQRILTWQLHNSVLERRSNENLKNDPIPFFATLPLNAPYPFDRVQYRKDFHHETMAWHGFRRRQPTVKDFYEDPLRWFIAKDRPFENERSAILDMAKGLWDDAQGLATEEVERWKYRTGEKMEEDENIAAGRDMRYSPRGACVFAHEKTEGSSAGGKERDLIKTTAEEFVFEWRRDLDRVLRIHRSEAPAFILEADLQIMRSRNPDLSQVSPIEILQGPIPARKANSLHRLVMDHMANPHEEINWHPEGPAEQLPRWTRSRQQFSHPSSPWTPQQHSPPTLLPQALIQPHQPSQYELQYQLELQQQFERQQQLELQQMLQLLFEQSEQSRQSQQLDHHRQPQPLLQSPQIELPQSQPQLQQPQIEFPQSQAQQQLPPLPQLQQFQLQLPEIQLSPIQQQQLEQQQLPSIQLPQAQPLPQLPQPQFAPIQLQSQFPGVQEHLPLGQLPQQPQLLSSSEFQGYQQLPPLFPSLEGDGSNDFDYFFN
ncbi:hypothetical protein EMPS_08876 [Entomortierella parvispora]|uniref:Uncharacterized protein n=1 Tax=Entomortierella parvispora TaxID=205924 RepID=A0A9P3HHP4_9FUNG|nr:hypothetical protein EMPS_08876 [Entomortierella parvispora]